MINKVTLLGRMARDPEIKTFQDGGSLANLRVITSRYWRDKSGEMKEQVQGHNVVIRIPKIASKMGENLKKGQLVYIEGSLETRKWKDQNGAERYSTEVVIRPYNGTIRRMPSSVQPNPAGIEDQTDHTATEPEESYEAMDFMSDMDDSFTSDF